MLTLDRMIGILDVEGVDCINGTKFTALSLDMPQMAKFGQLMYQYDTQISFYLFKTFFDVQSCVGSLNSES